MYHEAWEVIKNAKNVLIVSHVNPDGDTLGSSLALYFALKDLGKNVYLFNSSKILPKKYEFLPAIDVVQNRVVYKCDLMIACDCATFERTKLKSGDFKILNIDHHSTNQYFGDVNLVFKNASSTAFIVFNLLESVKVKITEQIATCLYVGIVEDSGFFSFGNIDENLFLCAAKLVQCGANTELVSNRLTQSTSLAKMRLHEYVLNSVDLLKNGTVAKVVIWQDDLKRTGAKREDTEEIANLIRELVSVKMSIMVLEEKSGIFKVSLRSKTNTIDVSVIASKFGGGGHYGAAGFESDLINVNNLVEEILNEYERLTWQ